MTTIREKPTSSFAALSENKVNNNPCCFASSYGINYVDTDFKDTSLKQGFVGTSFDKRLSDHRCLPPVRRDDTNFRAVKKTSLLYIPISSFSSSVKESDSYVPEAADGLSLGGAIFASRDESALRVKTGRGCRKQLVVVGRLYY